MEERRGSNKRKQPSPSDPFVGIFTRSKSQIYIHRNRSGRARSDAVRRRKNHDTAAAHWSELSRRKPKALNQESYDNDEISRISIKDLRARRVFSPALIVDECCSKPSENGEIEKLGIDCVCEGQGLDDVNPNLASIMEECRSDKDLNDTKLTETGGIEDFDNFNDIIPNLPSVTIDSHSNKVCNRDIDISACFEDKKASENGDMEKFDKGFSCVAQNLNDINPNLSEREDNIGLCNVEQRSNGEISNGVDDLVEECVQTTPPDSDLFGEPEVDENGGNRAECVLRTTDHDTGKPYSENIHRNDSCVGEGFRSTNTNRRNDSISKSKLVLNPCSRLKLFKTPSSFSYRRLLPFLMDIAKDNSYVSKVENDWEEKLLPPLLASHSQEIAVNKSNADSSHMECHTSDSCTSPTAILTLNNGSSSDNEPNLVSPEHVTETPMHLDSQNEWELQVGQVISGGPNNLEPAHENGPPIHATDPPAMSLCSPVSPEALSVEEDAIEYPRQFSVDAEEACMTSGIGLTMDAKPTDAVSLGQNSFQLNAVAPSEIPDVGLTKGILKRNPRGCRGLCNCLNCASFRLHAERAFEFSRNQMQDAEEVAFELVKELSYLRNILEKSADGISDHAVVQVNQVKEACRNASEAEELAKKRLSQMNYDLNIHSRITCLQRPRVSFANSVEEKVIPRQACQANSLKE